VGRYWYIMLGQLLESVVFQCFFYGSVAFLIHDYILTPFVYTPLACFTCKIDLNSKDLLDNQRKLAVEVFPQWFGKGLYSVIMMYMWFGWCMKYPGWEDWQNWSVYVRPMEDSDPEFKDCISIYKVYYSYVWWVFFKDILKPRKTKEGKTLFLQYMFDFHHLLALGLTHWSISNGGWRGGILTRIIHDPTDFILYWTKCIEAIYKSRTGKNSDYFLIYMMFQTCVVWFITRVFLYGIFVWKIIVHCFNIDEMLPYPRKGGNLETIIIGLTIGSFLMFVLQVVWFLGSLVMLWKYIKGHNTADMIHCDTKDKFQSKKDQ